MTETITTDLHMKEVVFTDIVLDFYNRQQSWTCEHLWLMNGEGIRLSEFIGNRGSVSSNYSIWDMLRRKSRNSIHNHPSSIMLPSSNDLFISLVSGGHSYIASQNGICELIVKKPKFILTAFKIIFSWSSIIYATKGSLNDHLNDLTISLRLLLKEHDVELYTYTNNAKSRRGMIYENE